MSASGNPSGCGARSGWSSAAKFTNTWAISVSKEYLDGKLYKVTFTLPSGYSFYNGGCARVKTTAGSSCLVGSIHSNGRKCTYTAPVI